MTQTLNSNCNRTNCTATVKFLYSYNGKILPRRSDGTLRYIGGITRVLSVDRSISLTELMVKFGELCGTSMSLKCKLPNEDLDVLVSIKSDEELKNVIEEYDRVAELTDKEMKVRAVLFPITSLKKISPPSSPMSVMDFGAAPKFQRSRIAAVNNYPSQPYAAPCRCSLPPAAAYSTIARKEAGRPQYYRHGSPKQPYYAAYSHYHQ